MRTRSEPHIERRRHAAFTRVDANQPAAALVNDALAELAHGWYGGTTPIPTTAGACTPASQFSMRLACICCRCSSHSKSVNISTLGRAKPPQRGQVGAAFSNKHWSSSTSGWTAVASQMSLQHSCRHCRWWSDPRHSSLASWSKPAPLELAIDVASERRVAVVHGLAPALEYLEADMGLGLPVQG